MPCDPAGVWPATGFSMAVSGDGRTVYGPCIPELGRPSVTQEDCQSLCGADYVCGGCGYELDFPLGTDCPNDGTFYVRLYAYQCFSTGDLIPRETLPYWDFSNSHTLHECASQEYTVEWEKLIYDEISAFCSDIWTDCSYCSGGPSVYDYYNGYCCPPCATGECWCEDTNECVVCDESALSRGDIVCEWDFNNCTMGCMSPCAAGYYWDGYSCVTDGGVTDPKSIQKGLSFVRHTLTGRLYVAYIDSNNLKVDIYTDAQTDTVGSTVTVDASGNCTAPRIICREDGVLEIIYITGTSVKIAQSRDSGTTWAVATTIVTSGYQLTTYGVPATMSGYSIIPVMLWNDSKWYVKVGVKTGASTYTFSSAVQVVASAAALPGTLLQRKDGVWEFLYTALPNTKTIIRCKALRSDGTGTWS